MCVYKCVHSRPRKNVRSRTVEVLLQTADMKSWTRGDSDVSIFSYERSVGNEIEIERERDRKRERARASKTAREGEGGGHRLSESKSTRE